METINSKFSFGEIVVFDPEYYNSPNEPHFHHTHSDRLEGTIIGMYFTKYKTFYNIIDSHYGLMFKMVESTNVHSDNYNDLVDKGLKEGEE